MTCHRQNDVVNKATKMRQMLADNAPVALITQAHEELYELNLIIHKEATLGLRKKRMGKVEWSPHYQLFRNRRQFRTMVVKKLTKVRMNKRY
jgi:hypothetical protein